MRPKATLAEIALVVIGVAGLIVPLIIAYLMYGHHVNAAATAQVGTQVPSATSQSPTTPSSVPYTGHIVERINNQGINTSWLVGSNGERYWIPTTTVFHCLANEGHIDLGPQSSTVLDELPDSGQSASCP
jgi:hypothetical protein